MPWFRKVNEILRSVYLIIILAVFLMTGVATAQPFKFSGSILDLDPPANQSTAKYADSELEQIVGSDENEPLSSFPGTDFYRELTNPVGRLAIDLASGPTYCTASLIDDTTILTNAHCIMDRRGNLIAKSGLLYMGYLSAGDERGVKRYRVDVAKPLDAGFPGPKGKPDFAILRVLEGSPGKDWGTISLSGTDGASVGQSLAIGHHPGGFPKVLSSGRGCRVARVSDKDLFHICDTERGSSGAPVFQLGKNAAIALHYRKSGSDENAAVLVSSLLATSELLRSIAGSVSAGEKPDQQLQVASIDPASNSFSLGKPVGSQGFKLKPANSKRGTLVPARASGQVSTGCLKQTGYDEDGDPIVVNECSYPLRVSYCALTSGSERDIKGKVISDDADCNATSRIFSAAIRELGQGAVHKFRSIGGQKILYAACPAKGYQMFQNSNPDFHYSCEKEQGEKKSQVNFAVSENGSDGRSCLVQAGFGRGGKAILKNKCNEKIRISYCQLEDTYGLSGGKRLEAKADCGSLGILARGSSISAQANKTYGSFGADVILASCRNGRYVKAGKNPGGYICD